MALYIPVKFWMMNCAKRCLSSPGVSSGLQARHSCGSVGNPECPGLVWLLRSAAACRRCCTVAPAAHDRQQEDSV